MKIDYLGEGTGKIAVYRWMPESGTELRGYVEICHGIAEHMGRYDELAGFLNDYGYAVIGHDHPGHGMTSLNSLGRVRGDAMTELLLAISTVNGMIREEKGNLPLCLLGHSMGSFLALRFMEVYPDAADMLILSGTSGRNNPLLEKAAVFLTSRDYGRRDNNTRLSEVLFFFYNMGFGRRSRFSWLNRDAEEVKKYENDPLCGFPLSNSFISSLVNGLSIWFKDSEIERIRKDLPILLIAGSEDPVGEKGKGVLRLAESFKRAGITDLYLRIYEGARHEILLEKEKKDTMNDVVTFIENMIYSGKRKG